MRPEDFGTGFLEVCGAKFSFGWKLEDFLGGGLQHFLFLTLPEEMMKYNLYIYISNGGGGGGGGGGWNHQLVFVYVQPRKFGEDEGRWPSWLIWLFGDACFKHQLGVYCLCARVFFLAWLAGPWNEQN